MSLAQRMVAKESRRSLQKRADFGQTLLRTMAALLIEHDGRLVVKRSSILLAGNLRVNAEPDESGNMVFTLQDAQGSTIYADQPAHAGANHSPDDPADDADPTPMVSLE